MTSDYLDILGRVEAAARRANHPARLLAVSKTKPADAIRALAGRGQRAFGENYVQEALAKQRELADLNLEWHMIGPLQSNKAREVAENFDWLQSLDREKLIAPLNRFRPDSREPLNVLIQVNIDDEASKSGCAPEMFRNRRRDRRLPTPHLRGLMAIPQPSDDIDVRRRAFRRMRELFDALRDVACLRRYAVDGHVRRFRARDRGRCDDGAHRHGVVRCAS